MVINSYDVLTKLIFQRPLLFADNFFRFNFEVHHDCCLVYVLSPPWPPHIFSLILESASEVYATLLSNFQAGCFRG